MFKRLHNFGDSEIVTLIEANDFPDGYPDYLTYNSGFLYGTYENWKQFCAEIGDGWRLMTIDELTDLFENYRKEKISNTWLKIFNDDGDEILFIATGCYYSDNIYQSGTAEYIVSDGDSYCSLKVGSGSGLSSCRINTVASTNVRRGLSILIKKEDTQMDAIQFQTLIDKLEEINQSVKVCSQPVVNELTDNNSTLHQAIYILRNTLGSYIQNNGIQVIYHRQEMVERFKDLTAEIENYIKAQTTSINISLEEIRKIEVDILTEMKREFDIAIDELGISRERYNKYFNSLSQQIHRIVHDRLFEYAKVSRNWDECILIGFSDVKSIASILNSNAGMKLATIQDFERLKSNSKFRVAEPGDGSLTGRSILYTFEDGIVVKLPLNGYLAHNYKFNEGKTFNVFIPHKSDYTSITEMDILTITDKGEFISSNDISDVKAYVVLIPDYRVDHAPLELSEIPVVHN